MTFFLFCVYTHRQDSNNHSSPLKELSGELLVELKRMLTKVPEQYYMTVKEMGISGTEVLRLTNGIRKIDE